MWFFNATLLAIAWLRVANAAEVADLNSLTTDDALALLKEWNLHHVFGKDFESRRYDGSTFAFATKADIDEEFPEASPLHRRTLFGHVQQLQFEHQGAPVSLARRLAAVKLPDFTGFAGVRVQKEKSMLALGVKDEIKIYRDASGDLQILANAVNFRTKEITWNGKPLKTEPVCTVSMARTYQSKDGVNGCIVRTCVAGFEPSADKKSCRGAYTYGVNFADSTSRKYSDWPTIACPTSTSTSKVYTAKLPDGITVKSTGFGGSRQYTQLPTSSPLYYYNNVLSTFTFGSAATTTFSGLIPGQAYEFHITAHDTSTNNAHKHHVGGKNTFTVIGTTTQTKTLVQTNVGNSIKGLEDQDDWDNILVTASSSGQVIIKQNGRLNAVTFRVHSPKHYAVNFADSTSRKYSDWPTIACPTSTSTSKVYTAKLPDGITVKSTGFGGSRQYAQLPTSSPLYYYNNVVSTFTFGSAATTTFSGLIPGQAYEFHIIAHDTSTNKQHKHHVGVKNVFTVIGTTTQTKTLVQTNVGTTATGLHSLDDWDNILVTAPSSGQIVIKQNGRLNAIIFRKSPYASPLYGVNFADSSARKYRDYGLISCPTSTSTSKVYTAKLPDGITVKSTGFGGSRQYTKLPTNNPLYYYNNVLSTFTFGSAATTTFSGLIPGQVYEFHIIAHDTSTNNNHKHHVGVKNVFTVIGTTTQKKTLVQTDVGHSPYTLHMLDDWDNILVTAPSSGQVIIKQNGRLSAVTFRQRPVCSLGFINAGLRGCKDVNECAANNGGCDSKRKCVNTMGGMKCGDCPTGFENSGMKGCKVKVTAVHVATFSNDGHKGKGNYATRKWLVANNPGKTNWLGSGTFGKCAAYYGSDKKPTDAQTEECKSPLWHTAKSDVLTVVERRAGKYGIREYILKKAYTMKEIMALGVNTDIYKSSKLIKDPGTNDMAFATSKTVAYLKVKNNINNDGCMIQSQPPYGECASGVGCILDGQDNRDRLNNHYCVADVATNAIGKWKYNVPSTTIVDHTVWFYMSKLAGK